MTGLKNEVPGGQEKLFGNLLASRPRRSLRETAKSSIGSILLHTALVVAAVWATASVGQEIAKEEEISFIELPPEEPPPPPPPAPKLDLPPSEPAAEIAKGFQTLELPEFVPPEIPAPSVGIAIREEDYSGLGREGGKADGSTSADAKTVDELAVAPTFTPMTVRPELKNAPEVSRALQRNYPPMLRDAGIGGKAVLWFFIDEVGTVLKTQVKTSSGNAALDDAAERVAEIMKFRPAFNRDKAVPVWVEIPIVFAVS